MYKESCNSNLNWEKWVTLFRKKYFEADKIVNFGIDIEINIDMSHAWIDGSLKKSTNQ